MWRPPIIASISSCLDLIMASATAMWSNIFSRSNPTNFRVEILTFVPVKILTCFRVHVLTFLRVQTLAFVRVQILGIDGLDPDPLNSWRRRWVGNRRTLEFVLCKCGMVLQGWKTEELQSSSSVSWVWRCRVGKGRTLEFFLCKWGMAIQGWERKNSRVLPSQRLISSFFVMEASNYDITADHLLHTIRMADFPFS